MMNVVHAYYTSQGCIAPDTPANTVLRCGECNQVEGISTDFRIGRENCRGKRYLIQHYYATLLEYWECYSCSCSLCLTVHSSLSLCKHTCIS